MGSGPASPAPGPRNQWREERGPHGARRWVNTRTGRIQYRDPGHPHPAFVEKQKEQRSKQEESAKEQGNSHDKGELSEPKKDVAKVLDTAAFDAHIKQHKTPELWRGVPKREHGEQFKTGDLRQGSGAYGPGIYVGYGYNGRDTASKAAGDEGLMTRMTLKPDAKVMTWDEAETTWEKEGKQGFSIEKYDSSEKAIAAWAKSKGVDALDVQHNEFMNVLNPQALVVEKPKDDDDGEGKKYMSSDLPDSLFRRIGKVMGRSGKHPISFYHGSPEPIGKFDATSAGGTLSFTPNRIHAENFGSHIHKVYLSVSNPIDLTAFDREEDYGAIDGHALHQTLKDHGIEMDIKDFPKEMESVNDVLGRTRMKDEIVKQAKKLGYDSIVRNDYKDGVTAEEVVVFDESMVHPQLVDEDEEE